MIDAEWLLRALTDRSDFTLEARSVESRSAERAKASGVGNRRDQWRSGGIAHATEHDRMRNAEQIANAGSNHGASFCAADDASAVNSLEQNRSSTNRENLTATLFDRGGTLQWRGVFHSDEKFPSSEPRV